MAWFLSTCPTYFVAISRNLPVSTQAPEASETCMTCTAFLDCIFVLSHSEEPHAPEVAIHTERRG